MKRYISAPDTFSVFNMEEKYYAGIISGIHYGPTLVDIVPIFETGFLIQDVKSLTGGTGWGIQRSFSEWIKTVENVLDYEIYEFDTPKEKYEWIVKNLK